MVPSSNWWIQRGKRVPFLDTDFHRNITEQGRKMLLTLGRHIYFTSECIRQAVKEMAEYSTSTFMPEFRGRTDTQWNKEAEAMIHDHNRYCDLAGPPYSMRTYRRALAMAAFVDGDIGTVYAHVNGQPYLQVIPGHRICSGMESIVEGGEYDGAEIIDGVIVGPYMQPLAYRVLTGDASDVKQYVDVPATSMCLHFIPDMPGQLRGLSAIGIAAWSIQDITESRRFELLAQKAGAGRVFAEYSESGGFDTTAGYASAPTSGADTSSHASGLWREVIDEGINTYFKANSGERLEAVKFDRPSANQQAFAQSVARDNLGSLGTSYDFVTDPTKIGGNSSRVMLEKLNRNISAIQDLMIEPAVRRFDAFRLGTWIDGGVLRPNSEWWMREYQGPPRWSGDRRYEAQAALLEVKAGVNTRDKWAISLSEQLDDVRDRNERAVTDLFIRAQRISAATGVEFNICLAKLESDELPPSEYAEEPEPEPMPAQRPSTE